MTTRCRGFLSLQGDVEKGVSDVGDTLQAEAGVEEIAASMKWANQTAYGADWIRGL